MAIRDTGTEQLIKDTAMRIFFAEGKFNATTQDIADAAGVARTVINYYFRSKDALFKLVFKEAMDDTKRRLDEVLLSSMPFKKKVVTFIDVFFIELNKYPYKESFMISEINSQSFVMPDDRHSAALEPFFKEIKQAMDMGEVRKMLPINFVLNLFSLIAYPLLTRPLFKHMLEIPDAKFEQLMQERKKMILELLFI
ncbi:TetR/AcrR family transcriptional regulator [Mucilaginibacter phyllosphaerae]|uniref:AcrR family transcriptional regulator n=1 Tax=Mucilaginibacter phyllosphaerae TaxID=1812349 RepID=A0A4Y8AHP5_9SPHI|nr:TetR/AcrR family transcriptional regulator [Mucilaginibacter phyllosphaerae]MBB3968715.1 AcrR family transcriptional regulator [Mucilaginibacter phyllosphaerae]TEW67649.1 TetR/AcrR family transcriptional regulator [Mucilaginibacter phyllosphaerae]GGH14325.1 TetR family transcriptional regulator [Mucilaginibacter phyllosphaerae]